MTIIYPNSITWEEFNSLLEKRLEEERSELREIEWISYKDFLKIHGYTIHHPLNNFGTFTDESQIKSKKH